MKSLETIYQENDITENGAKMIITACSNKMDRTSLSIFVQSCSEELNAYAKEHEIELNLVLMNGRFNQVDYVTSILPKLKQFIEDYRNDKIT